MTKWHHFYKYNTYNLIKSNISRFFLLTMDGHNSESLIQVQFNFARKHGKTTL